LSSPKRSAASRFRTVRIAAARNSYLAFTRQHFADFDYLIVMDMDKVNSSPLDGDVLERAIEFLDIDEDRAAVFGNNLGTYYDMWAFRHPAICPDDVWAELYDYAIDHDVSDEEAFAQTYARRIFTIPVDESPIEVNSAFGGLGIYKLSYIRKNLEPYASVGHRKNSAGKYGWETCEHVHFHSGLRAQGGRLYVLPYLINFKFELSLQYDPGRWRLAYFDIPPEKQSAARFFINALSRLRETGRKLLRAVSRSMSKHVRRPRRR